MKKHTNCDNFQLSVSIFQLFFVSLQDFSRLQTVYPAPSYSINAGGRLLPLSPPVVMGILNATPDSFYQRHEGEKAIRMRTRQMLAEGAAILDVGACSTRPGSSPVGEKEETRRLREALTIVRREAPDAVVSVDTFRAGVARMCVEEFGAGIVNDISGGEADKDMFRTVAELGVPYVLTASTGLPKGEGDGEADGQSSPPLEGQGEAAGSVLRYLGGKVEQLHELGVCDVILDPGFGFGKTLGQNYALMRNLGVLHELGLPLLVGVSHKRMVHELLGQSPAEAQNGTTVLHTIALMKGAHILRAHEVREAVECVKIVQQLTANCEP